MKIKSISSENIVFDNGDKITFDHEQDCCEFNYADFKQIEPLALKTDFTEPIIFERANSGFRFGNKNKMFFVPCYSDQNGYYTTELNIYYNGAKVLDGIDCEELLDD